MILEFRNRSGALIAEVDSDTIFADRITMTRYPCPICKQIPSSGRDNRCWYLLGTDGCAACQGVYAMPDEGELSDMLKKK